MPSARGDVGSSVSGSLMEDIKQKHAQITQRRDVLEGYL
jgi:hypothetical protein